MWQILYAPFDTEVFINITRYVVFPVSFSQDLGKNLLSFSLDTNIIKDDNGNIITVRTGDYILVTKDSNYNQVIFFGTAKKPKYKLVAFDQINNRWKKTNKFTSREKSFSVKERDYTYSFRDLNYVTNDILLKTKLGGTMSNGTIITKYVLGCDNINIGNFSVSYQGEMETIISVLEENLLYFKLRHFCEPDSVKLVKVFSQVYIFDNIGDTSPSHWTITDSSLAQGRVANPDFRGDKRIEPEYLVGWINPELEDDEDDIINSINIYAKVLFTGDTSDLERYERVADDLVDTYLLPYQAREIAYVSNNPIRTKILATPTPTSTSFNIDSDFSWQFKTGNIIMILTTANIQYFRSIASVVGDTINITDSLPFTPIGTEIIELASNLDIYLDSANFSKSIESGVVIDTSSNKDSKIRFLKRNIPNVGSSFVCYYSKVMDYPEQQTFPESISRYELRGFSKTLDGIYTKDQVKKIVQTIQNEKTNPVFTVKCFLPEIPSIGWKIWIDLTDTLTGFYKITSFDSKYYGQFRGKDVVESNLTISNRKIKASDYIKLVERKAKEALIRSSAPPNVHLSYNETLTITDTVEVTKNIESLPTYSLVALVATEKTDTHFKMNWKAMTGGFRYLLDVSQDPSFSTFILKNFAYNTLADPDSTISKVVSISGTYPFYYRVKAIVNDKLVATSNVVSTSDTSTISSDLQIDSNTLFFWKYQEGSGTTVKDETNNNLNGTIQGTLTEAWKNGVLVGDTHSLKLNGTDNYISNYNYLGTITDFTIRKVFIFETGDIDSLGSHTLFSKSDGSSGLDGMSISLEYLKESQKIRFSVFNITSSTYSGVYRIFEVGFTFIENIEYIIESKFKLADSNNSNLNTFKIFINGIEKSGTIFNYGCSNISAIKPTPSIPFIDGALKAYFSSNYALGKFKNIRTAFDLRYRSDSETIQDAKNLKLYKTNVFPSSITVNGITTSLNYNYIFSPQNSGDLHNYGSSTGDTPYLDRRNSIDAYPSWVNDEGIWGLDFTSSVYGSLKIPSNNIPNSNEKITIICIAKDTNMSSSYIYYSVNGGNGESYRRVNPNALELIGRNSNTSNYYYTAGNTVSLSNTNIFTSSINYNTRTGSLIANKTKIDLTIDANNIHNNINTSNAYIGAQVINNVYQEGVSNIIIKGLAIIYDTLSDDQIREIHRVMGF